MLKDYPPLLIKSNELIKAWRNVLQAFDKFSRETIKNCFFHLKMKVMLKILHHLSEENKLSIYDEKIFEYFDELTKYYQITIDLFNKNKKNIKTGKAKEILDGICIVLAAQLKQFRENQRLNEGISEGKSVENPIKIEKDKFITEQKISILDELDNIESRWEKKKINKIIIENRKNITEISKNKDDYYKFIKYIYTLLIEDVKEELYKCYIDKSKKGIEKLNDFHLRKAANFYYESIKQEKENIEAIIKIQVNALEEEIKEEAYKRAEEEIIQKILHTIREAYQHLGKEIEELESFFKEAENQSSKIKLYNYEEFQQYINKNGMEAYINDVKVRKKIGLNDEKLLNFYELYEEFNDKWEVFKKEGIKYWDKINKEFIENNVTKQIKNNIEMSEKILNLFLDFDKKYNNKEKLQLNTNYSPIIEGISQTINIKIESLKESIELFKEHIEGFLNNIKKDLKTFVKKSYLIEESHGNFINKGLSETETNYLNELLEQEIKDFNEKLIKQHEKIKQEVDKNIIKFLKEHLLFEISTYEEILHYSVSKLREEKEEIVLEYVKDIDNLTESIEEVLKFYKIEFINPTPHEKFNGKEHEVLMAEIREGFKKGEIIKTMNRGYLYNKQIVLKANVIAGK
ncbi:nucleotide exchange factor GrpE [Defluviitalea phaphyphila]|uniref:nucleotide exchange factor GrpE n=1 Tax=Defluviitalea phaphyphila TaxID=1473580 RepID=UPI000731A211|nr:nucleotide exchange factor GrpE [Defluviitalea phaphyphila]